MKTNLTKDKNYLLPFCAILFCIVIALAGDGFGQKKPTDFYAHLKAEHAAAVKNYIGTRADWRPAQVSDCRNKFGLDSFRQTAGKTAHPFYAVADFNQNGIYDFAVVLFDSNKAADERFTVLIFNGGKSGSYKMAYKSGNRDLRQGGIWTDGFGADDGKATVTAGVFETDDAIWIEWSGGKYVAHDASEAEN